MALKWGQRDSYGFELGCHTVKSALVAQYSFLETPAARSVLLLWAQNFLVAGRIPTSEHQEKNAPGLAGGHQDCLSGIQHTQYRKSLATAT